MADTERVCLVDGAQQLECKPLLLDGVEEWPCADTVVEAILDVLPKEQRRAVRLYRSLEWKAIGCTLQPRLDGLQLILVSLQRQRWIVYDKNLTNKLLDLIQFVNGTLKLRNLIINSK